MGRVFAQFPDFVFILPCISCKNELKVAFEKVKKVNKHTAFVKGIEGERRGQKCSRARCCFNLM